ncbi:hypothetical protein U5922_017455 [Aquicoccus sp. G2-2]|uniref:hypothetical protein n=1 Tax=Aquicoccus sp. G2-2 TaxID=3092120 RepID=UPI002AE08171|nr:hypothetical protein [Aquicoccus sp. G2-2]MEA1115166.1 hypothetical protein [Aquicoccus sp. G2-2]
MKIRKNTDQTLIVGDRPWLIGVMLILFSLIFTGTGLAIVSQGDWMGLIFVAVGLIMAPAFFAIFVRRVQVVFYRPEGWVEIRRKSVFGQRKSRYRIENVNAAKVESTTGKNGTLYRVALNMTVAGVTGTKPLTKAYSNMGHPFEVAEAINRWIGVDQAAGDTAQSDQPHAPARPIRAAAPPVQPQ